MVERPTNEDLKKIIQGGRADVLVEQADKFGKTIKKVSTSQIRGVFGTMKKLQMMGWGNTKVQAQFRLMKPRLAYMAARKPTSYEKSALKDVLTESIDLVVDDLPDTFENFCNFFEAILAYHKAYEGDKNDTRKISR